jgi:hypothetical protein
MNAAIDLIDQQIVVCQNTLRELVARRARVLAEEATRVRAVFPVVYVIHEKASATHHIHYSDYQRSHGAFSTQARAIAVMNRYFRNGRRDHHDCEFCVKADASVNVPDDRMLALDKDVRMPVSP